MSRVYELACEAEWAVARATLWAMVLLIFTAALARLLGSPMNWAIDMSTCLFAWSCFLSADVAWREDRLMNVDVLVRMFPKAWQRRLRLANYFIISLFLIYLMGYGSWLAYTTRIRTFQGIPGFSYAWVTLSVPVGAFFLFLTALTKIRREIKST
ncbi:MAG: TRAP transporter small permease subunit [bacterium]